MCYELFAKGRIQFALFEISPCFNGSYASLIKAVMSHGYRAYEIPSKHSPLKEAFEKDPLKAMLSCSILYQDVDAYIMTIIQENLLFVREDIQL